MTETVPFDTVVFDTVVLEVELGEWVVKVELGSVDDWGMVVDVEAATVVSTPTLYVENSKMKLSSYLVQVSVLAGKQTPTRTK